ncbi:MAG: Ppx/GppA family phosphatase [Pseudomonadales bacterium]|jgi:exopolyphosphatase/guanosine-5'-triphosphate,3'-diphosphate pyrophosphatase|nr:Ppx/GppA family phosphatase [Pseudomonadales bacterium]
MNLKASSPYFAGVDLGSNSFHLVIARVQDGKVEIIDREREMVQLARGADKDGYLSREAQRRALACLERFAERLRDIPREHVRAVGTKALRSARQSKQFLQAAENALGAPLQIISGFEEARLVYTGLAHSVTNDSKHRLVVDIGGGSTEFIIGMDYEPLLLESLNMGCVTYTEAYFGKNGSPAAAFKKAYTAACSELEMIRRNYLETGWDIAYGTSGTARAIADLVQQRDGGAMITAASLEWLSKDIVEDKSRLNGLPALRRAVLPAGLAILKAIFDQFKLEHLHVGDYALKEGLLYDSIGRFSDADSRELTVRQLQAQYLVDVEQAARVSATALTFWKQIEGPLLPGVSRTKILGWAARLHEIGMSISHSGHHHHGYYILRHSDLAGFGRYEQYVLANLLRSQRKGLYQEKFEGLGELALSALLPLIVCLRLAVLLHRCREELNHLPALVRLGREYRLKFRKDWLERHPLTLAGLEQEKRYYEAFELGLSYE